MSKDEIISNVLDGFLKVQELLGTSDIELCLKTDNSNDPFTKSKEFIDELFVLSKNLKESFYELYTKYQKDQNKESEENTAVPNSILSNGLVSDYSINNDTNEQNDVLQEGTSNVDCSDENMGTLQDDQNEILKLNSVNETDVKNIGLSKDQDVEIENIENQQPRRSLIRLVDLNKLIDPDKHKKSVKFDTSVIVLSSSDDENNVINSEKNKITTENTTKKQKPDSSESEDSNQNNDNDSENRRKSRRLKKVQKLKSSIKETYKKIFNDFKKKHMDSSKTKTQVEVISDSSSDSETEKPQRKSTRTSLGRSCKMDDAKLNSKVSEKLESLRRSKRTRVENETSSDPDKSLKKKSKTVDDEELPSEGVKVSKKSLRNRKRGTDKNTGSEGDSDEDNSTKKKTKSKKKNVDAENIKLKDEGKDSKSKYDEIIIKKVRFKNDIDEEFGKEDIDGNKSEDEVEKPVKKSSKDKNDSESENEETSTKRKMNKSKNDSKNDEEKPDEDKLLKKKVRNKKNATKEQSEKETGNDDTEKKLKADNSYAEEQKGLENEEDPLAVDDPLSTENVLQEQDDGDITVNKVPTQDSLDETLEMEDKNDKSDNSNDVDDADVSNKKDADVEDESKDPKNKKTKNNNDNSDSNDDKKLESDDEANEENKEEEKSLLVSSDDDDETIMETKKHSAVSSDSDEEFGAFSKKRDKSNKDLVKKTKKRIKAVVSDSESGNEENRKNEENESNSEASKKSSEGSEGGESDGEEESSKKKTAARRRIRKAKDSSESDEEVETRKNIRKVLGKHSLSETTKQAEADEKERKARIAEKQKKYNRMFEEKKDAKIDKVVLDYDEKTKEPALEVHKKIVKNLKPHQVSGIQFMYDACFESVERMKNSGGSGCILAHCMGLGKTLQVISLLHTLLVNGKKTKVKKAMVVCPINTVLNWKSEFKKWLPSNSQVEVHELATPKKNYERQYIVNEWHEDGGVLILGYNMFRLLSNPNNKKITKKMRTAFLEGMVDPGPDIVICDEGHLLKNEKTNLSIAMNRIKTPRRIVLTGTPLQNNLKEYWCMVQFIKPNLLGTYKEYMNRFVNPITNGQYTDSTRHDTDLMRKRSHVLHKLLDGVVQRRDYAVLEPYLPPKHEYVLFVKLADVQIKLYKHYIEKYARRNDGSNRTSFLFADFQEIQRICTHPRVMKDKSIEKKEKWDDEEESEGSLKDFIDDGEVSARSTSSTGSESDGSGNESDGDKKKKKPRMTRARAAQKKDSNDGSSDSEIEETSKEWWQEFCDGDELDNIRNSGKLTLLFEILRECEDIGDKILVFSQSLYALNCIEYFLGKIDEATQAGDTEKIGFKGSWSLGLDYFRIDGSSSCDNRAYWCDSFNNPENIRARLFLISTKAGGLGINLVAANRVIIFDVSWNPSHDVQSIYRVYRFGQTKPSYIYRFVTYGAMEMKIYERQVTKQAISKRVIDEQQIDRHYNQNDLQELYKCDLEPTERPLPMVPKDVLLGEMLQKHENVIYKYHLHQSLLENKHDEGLNEEERKAAWEEFENEKVLRKTTTSTNAFFAQAYGISGATGIQNMSAAAINAALVNIVRRDNPTWSEQQIKGIIPALVRQLQVQIEEQDMSMYQRVVQEIQIMNQARLKESLYQQQVMKLYQQQYLYQKQQQSVLGSLNINPQTLQSLYGQSNFFPDNTRQFANGPSTSSNTSRRPAGDVIELND